MCEKPAEVVHVLQYVPSLDAITERWHVAKHRMFASARYVREQLEGKITSGGRGFEAELARDAPATSNLSLSSQHAYMTTGDVHVDTQRVAT